MKPFLACILLSALLITGGNRECRAEGAAEIEAGVKSWFNRWESKDPALGSITSDTVALIGPAVSVTFPNAVFLEGSFLLSASDYEFSDHTGTGKIDRRDLDAAIGYRITREIGLLAGYRTSWFQEQETGDRITLYGPELGITGTAPVTDRFFLYADFSYLFTRFKQENILGTLTEDSPGWIVEAGVGYLFTKDFSATAGYRYETNKGKESDVQDSFDGFTLAGYAHF